MGVSGRGGYAIPPRGGRASANTDSRTRDRSGASARTLGTISEKLENIDIGIVVRVPIGIVGIFLRTRGESDNRINDRSRIGPWALRLVES